MKVKDNSRYFFIHDFRTSRNLKLKNVLDLYYLVRIRDGRFGSKVGQIGPQIGQIRDFFRSDTFGPQIHRAKCTEIYMARQ